MRTSGENLSRSPFPLFAVLLTATLSAALSSAAGTPASPSLQARFRLEGKIVEFVTVDDESVMISQSCLAGAGGTPRCQAYSALDSASLHRARQVVPDYGGKNPGSIVCRGLQGSVVIGTDAQGNENAFCRFKDGSWISCGSLSFQATLNDQAWGLSR